MYDMVETEGAQRLLERGTVEVAPLAFMPRSHPQPELHHPRRSPAREQMKMFLTRIGFGARVVVTADMTQVDLPTGRSGMTHLACCPASTGSRSSWGRRTSCATASCRTSSTPTRRAEATDTAGDGRSASERS